MSGRLRHVLFGLFVLACLAAVSWPGPALITGRLGPVTLGLPSALAWNVLWVGLSFAALLAYHAAGRRR